MTRRFGVMGFVAITITAGSWLAASAARAEPPPADPAGPSASGTVGVAPAPTMPPKEKDEARPAPNSIYAEGLGAGLLYSINYERRVIDDLGVRIGFSYTSFSASATAGSASSSASSSFITIPVTASYLGVRSGKSALEVGGGMTLVFASGSASGVGVSSSGSGAVPMGVAMVGYRLHPVGGAGFQFRVGVMAIVAKGAGLSSPDPTSIGVLPWGYISFGAGF